MLSYGLMAAFIALLCNSIDVAIAKHLTKKLGKFKYSVSILGIGVLPMLAYLLVVGVTGFTMEVVILSLASSVFLGTGYILYYKTLETQQITNASIIGQIQPALLLLFGVFVLGEVVTAVQILGMIAIFAGSSMILVNKGMKINKFLIPLIIANVLWAVYWVLMDYSISLYNGISLPLLVARFGAFAFIAAYTFGFAKFERRNESNSLLHSRKLLLILIVSGTADSLLNIFFGAAFYAGLVAVASAIVASSPLLIAVFGRVLYGDRITNLQKIGLVAAVIGAIAISLG